MTAVEFVAEPDLRANRSSPRRWILSHLLRHGWLIPVALLGALGNAALAGVVPVIVGQAFDDLRPGVGTREAASPILLRAALLIVVSQAVRALLQLARNGASEFLAQRFERDARGELYASLLGKSMTFHGRQPVGDTMARATNDIREVNLMLNPGLNLVVGSGMFLLVPVIFAARIHPQLVAVPGIFVVSYGLALRRYLQDLAPMTREVRRAFGAMNAGLTEAVDGVEVVKAAAQERFEEGRFADAARAYRDAFVRQGEREARFLPLLLLGLAVGVGFLHSLRLYRAGAVTLGEVVGYAGLLQLFGFPTFVSLFAYSQVSSGIASARRILELINRESGLDENLGGHAGPMRGALDLTGVTFGYEGGADVLHDVDLHLEPGQTLAIVGQTGSGKTTLTRLVNRTYDVRSGSVAVDGVDVRHWSLESLRRQIAVIEQDPFLMSRSIADNIGFGAVAATAKDVETAARAAQAHDFIVALPDGYDTVVGERGVTLSGGQRQRIAIARALLADPRIIILDDATSAIDSETEEAIQRAMWRAAEGRTTILITHRLSQIRWADLILVLRQGRVVDCGDHQDLLERCPAYRRLFRGSRRV